jgi:hypothetical protein
MAHMTTCVVPLVTAAQSLTEEAKSLVDLHHQELRHVRRELTARLDAAIEALAELVDVLNAPEPYILWPSGPSGPRG